MSDIFTGTFTNLGGVITAVEAYSSGDEFERILRRHSRNKPDVIFCPEDYASAAKLINIAYETGFSGVNILGIDAWDGILVYVSNPEAMKNIFYSAPFSFDDQDEEVVRFVRNYFAAFSQMPMSGSATAYTCVYILTEAIKTAGSTDKHDLIRAIKNNELNVITGHIKFDEENNPHTNVYIIQIDGGVYSTYEKISL